MEIHYGGNRKPNMPDRLYILMREGKTHNPREKKQISNTYYNLHGSKCYEEK